MKRSSLCSAILLTIASMALFAQPAHLRVTRTLPLTDAADGFNGSLELLEDARLTSKLEEELWGSGGPEMALDEKDPRYKDFAAVPLRKAMLQLKDARQKVVAEKTLERELARIRTESLYPGKRIILVTTDLSAGLGSYSGPCTELLQVIEGRIEPIMARSSKSGAREPIRLASTLKTAWKPTPSAGGPNSQKDILEVACRPESWGQDEAKFFNIYTRYHWNGAEWISYQRKTPGFWEADHPFPQPQLFPGPETKK